MVFPPVRVNSFCCGYSLKTGCLFIGYTGSILWGLCIIMICALGGMSLSEASHHPIHENFWMITIPMIVCFVIHVLLVVGIEKERVGFLMVFMAFQWILIIALSISIVVMMVMFQSVYPLFLFPVICYVRYQILVVDSMIDQLNRKLRKTHTEE